MHAPPLRTMRIASARRKQLAAWMHVRASASSVWAFECARVSQYTCAQRSSVGVALWQGRARLRARVAHVIVSKHWSMGEYPSSACSASAADPILFSATGPIRRPMPKGRSPNRWQAIESRPPHGAACHSAESHRRRRRRCCASVCDGLQRTRRGGERAAHICVGLARICAGTRSHLRRNSAALPQQCAALSRAPRPCVSPARSL
jgi:hypothetical protein